MSPQGGHQIIRICAERRIDRERETTGQKMKDSFESNSHQREEEAEGRQGQSPLTDVNALEGVVSQSHQYLVGTADAGD